MTDPTTVQQNIQTIRVLSNDLAGFLHTLSDNVWRDADTYASACDQWNMADVVAHLISGANLQAMSIQGALKGSTKPPMGYQQRNPDERVQSVKILREAYDEDLFPEFNASCLRLNRMLVDLEPDHYELPTWHPAGIRDIGRLIEIRLIELAIHTWDIRYGVDRNAPINSAAISFLKNWVSNWLRAGFRPPEDLQDTVTFHFNLTDSEAESYDLMVSSDDFSLDSTDRPQDVDAIFSVDSSSYILFLMGRLPVRRSIRRGRIKFEGDQELAEKFSNWFVRV